MSNWATHALIGAVAGLALVQLAPVVVNPEDVGYINFHWVGVARWYNHSGYALLGKESCLQIYAIINEII